MKKILKSYQETSINALVNQTEIYLNSNGESKIIIFDSPTGSGKTFMAIEYIKRINDLDINTCFFWVCIGKGDLHKQSYKVLKKENQSTRLLDKNFIQCNRYFNNSDIVVINWEKINNKKKNIWDNVLMRKGENSNNLESIINTTKNRNTKIILIIDESHTSSNTERANELRESIIKPDLTIEMSATPCINNYNHKVEVNINNVKEEGMIKKSIIINSDIKNIIIDTNDTNDEIRGQDIILLAALKKRNKQKELFESLTVDINPLILVQVPTGPDGNKKIEMVKIFLTNNNINTDNGKLGIWLDKEKINIENISNNNNKVEWLIFKQAITTGWDCPRASILVRLREPSTLEFDIQTVGRILRMPEAKHYDNYNLDCGFIYTNVGNFELKEDIYNLNIKYEESKRKNSYIPLSLKSYYIPKVDYGDITNSFKTIINNTLCEKFNISYTSLINDLEKIKEKIKIGNKDDPFKEEIIENKKIDINEINDLKGKKVDDINSDTYITLSNEEIKYKFVNFIKDHLGNFINSRSNIPVQNYLYSWFRQHTNIDYSEDGTIYIQKIILNINNISIFSKVLSEAIEKYIPIKEEEINIKKKSIENINYHWEIPEINCFNKDTKIYEYKKIIYSPCYLNINNLEENFINYLESSDDILWWYKNQDDLNKSNFGIGYIHHRKPKTFLPDFIVKFKDDRIGIFETKAIDFNENINKLKAETLQKYIKEENDRRNDINIVGGIIVENKVKHFKINQQEIYYSYNDRSEDWKDLNTIIENIKKYDQPEIISKKEDKIEINKSETNIITDKKKSKGLISQLFKKCFNR